MISPLLCHFARESIIMRLVFLKGWKTSFETVRSAACYTGSLHCSCIRLSRIAVSGMYRYIGLRVALAVCLSVDVTAGCAAVRELINNSLVEGHNLYDTQTVLILVRRTSVVLFRPCLSFVSVSVSLSLCVSQCLCLCLSRSMSLRVSRCPSLSLRHTHSFTHSHTHARTRYAQY